MYNKTILVGRTTKDLELKVFESGKSVCNFSLAVNRPYTNDNGEKEVDFIQCQVWGKDAENLVNYVSKGQLILVEGATQTRTYDKDGETRYVTEVNCQHIQYLESKRSQQEVGSSEADIRKQWTDEWNKKSVGLAPNEKATLKSSLHKKYQPMIDKLSLQPADDLPF